MEGVEEDSCTQPAGLRCGVTSYIRERESCLPRHDGENSCQEEQEILSRVSQVLLHHPVGTGQSGALVPVTNTVVDEAEPDIEEDGHQEGRDLYPGLVRSNGIFRQVRERVNSYPALCFQGQLK